MKCPDCSKEVNKDLIKCPHCYNGKYMYGDI